MNPERWSRIKDLFSKALEEPAADRAAWLRNEAGGDPELLGEVESLLRSYELPGKFLDEPVPIGLRVEAIDGHAQHLGERIGAYRIVEMIGTGGMGDVFKAVRDDDQYRAEVAIKLMRSDVRNPLAEQRFKNERQILAALDHRNIARLLDGGTTPQGLPYVVMELVNGKPIDQYCDEKSLGIHDRLQLFLQVCAAVSYAHQHLVVHRDLKPNNILVTADGSVKLLDFGIAKLLEPEAVTGTVTEETRTQLRAMTLEYASPEQVSGGPVTTVSDVYSLGVVLYRLLTGQSPYRAEGGDVARMAEILGDTSPTRPSQVEARTRESIDSDLDHVLLMALRKEPAKRYGSVEQLTADLRHFLAGQPVNARRGTLAYRAGKFARRNKVPIAAALLVVLALAGGLGFAIREARIAERQRAIAQRHFDSVRQLANTLLAEFDSEIAALPGATKAREKLVKTSLGYLDSLYQGASSDPGLQKEVGVAYRRVGEIQGSDTGPNLGDSRGARESYDKSIALLEPLVTADPSNHRAGIALAQTYLQLTRLVLLTDGGSAALPLAEKTAALSETHAAGIDDDVERSRHLVAAYWARTAALGALGRVPQALDSIEEMVEAAEACPQRHVNELCLDSLADAYSNAAVILSERLPPPEGSLRSINMYRKSLGISESLVALKPANPKYQRRLAEDRFNLADALYDNGEYPEAVGLIRLAAPVLWKRADDPADVAGQWAHAMVDIGLAQALVKTGEFDEATTLFTRAERKLLGLEARADNLRVQYALMKLGFRRGDMYVDLAGNSRGSRSAQRGLWLHARQSLSPAVARAEKLNQSFKLEGAHKVVWDDGIAALARAEAALAVP